MLIPSYFPISCTVRESQKRRAVTPPDEPEDSGDDLPVDSSLKLEQPGSKKVPVRLPTLAFRSRSAHHRSPTELTPIQREPRVCQDAVRKPALTRLHKHLRLALLSGSPNAEAIWEWLDPGGSNRTMKKRYVAARPSLSASRVRTTDSSTPSPPPQDRPRRPRLPHHRRRQVLPLFHRRRVPTSDRQRPHGARAHLPTSARL